MALKFMAAFSHVQKVKLTFVGLPMYSFNQRVTEFVIISATQMPTLAQVKHAAENLGFKEVKAGNISNLPFDPSSEMSGDYKVVTI